MHNRGGSRGGKTGIPDQGYFINKRIKAREVRFIAEDGENRGVISLEEALNHASERGLDLVQMGDGGGEAPIVKVMDFGKFLYEKKKQQNAAKKNQKIIQVKELKFRPRIDEGDYRLRINKAADFLKSGKRVKFTVQFRGREIPMMSKLGGALFARIQEDLEALQLGALVAEKESRGVPIWSKVFYLRDKS